VLAGFAQVSAQHVNVTPKQSYATDIYLPPCLPACLCLPCVALCLQNACSGVGDAVQDTPFCASPTQGCPAHKDTCPQPGEDPVSNYMDYSDDSCQRQLTSGQHQRIEQMWKQYRLV
jgi:hypothetical protein